MLLWLAFRRGQGQTGTALNRRASHNPHFQSTLWCYLTGRRGEGEKAERLWEYWQGFGPICFTFWLLLRACSACVQMGISVSHSSSPNWHLTAAPHGLIIALCFHKLFPGVGSSSDALNITQLRGRCLLHPFTPSAPSPILRSLPFPCSYLGREGVCTRDSPKRSLSLSSVGLSLWNPPLLLSLISPPPPPPHLLSIPLSHPLWKSSGKKTAGYWRCSASRLRAKKRQCIYGRHMATFSKSYLYLTRPINHKQISFSALVAWQKACSSTDAGSKFVRFYILSIKVIIIFHWGNLTWKKMFHIFVNVMFTHIWACGCHIRLNEAKWSKAKHRHSRSLGCRRLTAREVSWEVYWCKHQVPFSMQIDLFLRNVVAQLYDGRVEWPLFLKVSETA